MNRNTEYEWLKDELTLLEPIRNDSLEKAKKKIRNRRYTIYPVTLLCSLLAVFIVLVNVNPQIAIASMKIPGVKDLVKAVAYSESLIKMVENDHIQYLLETDEKNGITVHWDYLIVDNAEANLVIKIDTKEYLQDWEVELYALDSMEQQPADWEKLTAKGWGSQNRYKRMDGTMINRFYLEEDAVKDIVFVLEITQEEVLSRFELPVSIDSSKIKEEKIVQVNQELELDGQIVEIDSLHIYPTHTELHIFSPEVNSKEVKWMDYTICTDRGESVLGKRIGRWAHGSSDYPGWLFLETESIYYKEMEYVEIIITNVQWKSRYYVEGSRHKWNGEKTIRIEID